MATRLTVIADTDTLRKGNRGSITGRLYVRVDDLVFPDESWNDFPVVVLGWWARECRNVLSGEHATFTFMDGPLEFSLRPQAGSEAVVEFMRDGATGRAVVASATVEPQSVVDAVLDAGRNVLAACRERSWRNRDVEQLATSIEEASRPTTR